MAKGLKQTISIAIAGILDITGDGNINVEIEDIGTKDLAEILAKLDGEPVSITAKLQTEME